MQTLVIFDVDKTLVRGQSQNILLNYLFKKRIIGFWYYIKILWWFILYKMHLVKNPRPIMEYAFSFWKGQSEEYANKMMDDFFETTLKKYIYPEAVEIINNHIKNGDKVMLLSNAIEPLIKRVAKELGGVDYVSTRLEIVGGKFTGKMIDDMVYGPKKIEKIRDYVKKSNLSLENSWAYADHISDLGLLELSTHPVAVNPDKFLIEEARKRSWQVLKFK
jgi:HAD superfamily hydrolase (TIGR01490 family)